MLLKGTADGFAMVALSQGIEVDRTRRLLQDELLADTSCPQILVQVGWAPGSRSARRVMSLSVSQRLTCITHARVAGFESLPLLSGPGTGA